MNSERLERAAEAFKKLVELMDTLRKECPWDAKQTHKSLQKYTIEELYELMDAINNKDTEETKEELGDLLFHTIFYSKIAEETNDFCIIDVINSVYAKLVNRHPHVFGNVSVKNEEDVSRNWEQLKLKEGKKSILDGVPKSLPALVKAYRIQEKAKQVGFEWPGIEGALDKLKEEIAELESARRSGDENAFAAEFGDVLFSFINYARYANVDPEQALELSNRKFIERFQFIEKESLIQNKNLKEMNLEEMDALWNKAKTARS